MPVDHGRDQGIGGGCDRLALRPERDTLLAVLRHSPKPESVSLILGDMSVGSICTLDLTAPAEGLFFTDDSLRPSGEPVGAVSPLGRGWIVAICDTSWLGALDLTDNAQLASSRFHWASAMVKEESGASS